MKKILLILISLLIFKIASAQTEFETKIISNLIETQIYFDFNQLKILPAEQVKINNLLETAKADEGKITQIVVRGHTDNFGSDYYNKKLSNKRAETVEKYLISSGISSSIIAIQGYGEVQLLITKGNKTEQQTNRRVRIELTYKKMISVPKPIIEKEKTITDFFNNTKKPYESFAITAGEATFVEGKEGTRIQFSDTSFDQLPTGTPIEIRLTEYYRFSDMLLANLTTEINGEMLSTGGMINAEAFANGEPINMTGQAYVWFPHKERNMDNMQPFFGEEGEQGVTWNVYAENFNESRNMRINYFYTTSSKRELEDFSYPIAPEKLTKWETFWHIFMYGKEDYLMTINGYDFTGKRYVTTTKTRFIDTKKAIDDVLKGKTNPDAEIHKILDYEIMNINRLGLINCDAFYNVPEKDKKMLTIMEKPSNNLSIKVLCKRVNGIIAAYPRNGKYVVQGLPKDEKITIIAVKTIDNQIKLAIKKLDKIKNINQNDLVFQSYDNIDDMRKAMRVLD